jgi:hypothetical protein
MQRIRLVAVLTALGAILLLSTPLMASLDRGAIRGTVTDPQGAVVPEAAVVVTNVDTGVETRLTTNAAGFYLAAELVPGRYTIRIEASGFSPLEIKDVMVTAGTTVTSDVQLKVGPTTQRVEVSAQAQLVETTSSNFSTGVARRYLENIPFEGRDIQTLVQLFPGIIQSSGPSASVFGFNSQFGGFPDPQHLVGSSISANGGQAGANGWYLEGSLNATVGAESTVVNPSPDAVSEFNIVQNGLAAEYGRTSGVIVNVVLKSGTNDLHGSLYGYNRNSKFSATNPYARRDEKGEPFLQPWVNWNNFGGTLGGPVYIPGVYNGKNRTFFFVSDEMSFLHQRQNQLLTVPLPNAKKGDFRGDPRYADVCDPANGVVNCIYDPLSYYWDEERGYWNRVPFTTPVVPEDRIDPLAKFYVDSIPDPNFLDPLQQGPGGCGNVCNNYIGAVGSSMTTHNVSVKVDHVISDKYRLYVNWLFNPSYYTNYRFPWNGPTAPTGTGIAGSQPYDTLNQVASLGLTSTLTPTLVNELRFSYGRQNLVSKPNLESVTHNKEVQQRVAGLNFYLFEPFQPVPTISFTDFDTMVFGPLQSQNNSQGQQAFTLSDSVTKVVGRHTIKSGFSFRRNNLWAAAAYGYNINFDGLLTNDPLTWAGGNGLAQFLLGAVPQGGGSSGVQHAPWQTNDDWSAYAQDDFRVSKNLTLSIGLRWDVYGWIRERHNMLANFDLTTKNPEVNYMGRIVYMGTPDHPDRNLFPANKRSFGPRFGFAWSPFGSTKTVIRGGYGLIYSNSLSALFGQGNGAFSSMGSSQGAMTPIYDYSLQYIETAWILSQGAPSLVLPDLTAMRNNNDQLVGAQFNVFGFIKGDKDPYVQQWSLILQRELPGNIMVSAGYVGSHGLHLSGDEIRNIDEVPKRVLNEVRYGIDGNFPADISMAPNADSSLNPWGCEQDLANNQALCNGWFALQPYPQWWSVQSLLYPDGYNKYHSAQFRVEKRYSHGLNFIAAYTISKNMVSAGLGALVANTIGPSTLSNRGVGRIRYIPGAAGGGVADGSTHTGPEDQENRRRYDALSPDDTPQVFNFASTWELPFGKGKKWGNTGGVANAFIGGWKFTQNWNFQSGVPMFFSYPYWTGYYYSKRLNLVGDPSAGRSGKTKEQRAEQWWDPAAFCPAFGCDPALAEGFWNGVFPDGSTPDYQNDDRWWTLGNIGLRPPSGRTPGFWNADMSLAKDFRFGETKRLTFRWDVFNALNHQNLGIPNSTWCLPPGPNGETDYSRQFGCQFGRITSIQTDPRSMQFALRFEW